MKLYFSCKRIDLISVCVSSACFLATSISSTFFLRCSLDSATATWVYIFSANFPAFRIISTNIWFDMISISMQTRLSYIISQNEITSIVSTATVWSIFRWLIPKDIIDPHTTNKFWFTSFFPMVLVKTRHPLRGRWATNNTTRRPLAWDWGGHYSFSNILFRKGANSQEDTYQEIVSMTILPVKNSYRS